MGKKNREPKDKDEATRVIFKKSNNTLYTHSRTCSGTSQLYTKSGRLKIKSKQSQNNEYYVEGNKVKRDLSIETDICVLRRYYKNKRSKLSSQEGVSAKSRYSTVLDAEINPIEEFEPDTSACGDNEHTKAESNNMSSQMTPDIATVMIENFKRLLNNWIQKHLIDNKNSGCKINSILDAILHKLDKKETQRSSSCSTYTIEDECSKPNTKNTTTVNCQYCKRKAKSLAVVSSNSLPSQKTSLYTVPFPYKHIRIISTLSIPRNFHKHKSVKEKERKDTVYKVKKMNHKKLLLSISRPSRLLIDSSSFDLLAISTKSLTKRCVVYEDMTKPKKRDKKRRIIFAPKPPKEAIPKDDNKSVSKNDNSKTETDFDTMPSIIKDIYADDPSNVTSSDFHLATKNDFTMTETNTTQPVLTNTIACNASNIKIQETVACCKTSYQTQNMMNECDQSDPLITIDYINQSLEIPKLHLPEVKETKKNKLTRTLPKRHKSKKSKMKKYHKKPISKLISHSSQFKRIEYKHFTYLYNRANNKTLKEREFLNHLQDVFRYFANYEGDRNITLDIHINVFPMLDKDSEHEYARLPHGYEIKPSPTITYNVNHTIANTPFEVEEEGISTETLKICPEYQPEIIPLLDTAASQAKYIFNGDNYQKSEEKIKINSNVSERSTITENYEIVQEISELRSVIKELASAAEKIVSERMKTESNKLKSNLDTTVLYNSNFPSVHRSLSVKESKKAIKTSNPSKGIQISNDFAKKQLVSGLKLTKSPRKKDAFEFYNRLMKKSTSYHIIDSESILRVTDMTSAANEVKKSVVDEALTCSLPKSRSLFEVSTEKNTRKLIAFYCDGLFKNQDDRDSELRMPHDYDSKKKSKKKKKKSKSKADDDYEENEECDECNEDICPSIYIDMDNGPRLNKFAVRTRRGIGFFEGCFYCFLLWIPVIITAYLFYIYVILDLIEPHTTAVGREGPLKRRRNISQLKPSDFGF